MECTNHDPLIYDNSLVCANCGLVFEDWCEPEININTFSSLLSSPINGAVLKKDLQLKVISLYEQCVKQMNVRGKSKLSLLGLCLFYTCNTNSVFMTMKHIRKHLRISRRSLNQLHNRFLLLNPQFRLLEMKPSDFVPMYFVKYDLPIEHLQRTMRMCQKLDNEKQFLNSNPAMVCFCFIFKHLGVPITRTILNEEGYNHSLKKRMCNSLQETLGVF